MCGASDSWAQRGNTPPKPAPVPAKPMPKAAQTFPAPAPPLPSGVLTFAATDSLFLQVEGEQKYILHRVRAGESLYLLKRFYGIELADLYYANPDLAGASLRANQILRIPIVSRAIRKQAGAGFVPQQFLPLYYRVRSNETLYRIAKVYFKMPIEVLQHRNQLLNESLTPNRVLHIGWIPRTGIPDSLRQYNGIQGSLGEENHRLRNLYEAQKIEKKEVATGGVACWLKGERFSSHNKLHVLYSGAPIGTILRIENPMFASANNFIYAQVVGALPDNSFTNGCIVLLSSNVAFVLGGLDAKFFVKVYRLE